MSSQPEIRILVLGASYAGLSLTHHLLQHVLPKLPTSHRYKIILISTSATAMCRPACPRAMLSDAFFDQQKLFVSVERQLARYPKEMWEVIVGRVTHVDPHSRSVSVVLTNMNSGSGEDEPEAAEEENGRKVDMKFDSLIITTGSSTPSPLLGLNTTTETHLRHAWETFRTALPHAKHIVVSGGGPAGVEVAGELGAYLNFEQPTAWSWSRPWAFPPAASRKKQEQHVKITLITSTSNILPALRPSLGTTAQRHLAALGVEIRLDTKVVSTSPPLPHSNVASLAAPTTLKLSTDEDIIADLYIPCTGTKPNTGFLSHVPEMLTSSGHVCANASTFRVESREGANGDDGEARSTQTTQKPQRIYAIGDCSSAFKAPSIHNILSSIPVLSANVERDLRLFVASPSNTADGDQGQQQTGGEKEEDKLFVEDMSETQLVPVGRRKGVGAFKGWKMPSWVVWAIKGRDYWVWTTGRLWSGKQWE